MPADASIYGLIKPAQAQPGPMDQMAQVMQIKHLMGAQGLQDLQTQELQRGIGEQGRIRDLFSSGGNVTPEQVMAIDPKTGMAYQKNMLESQKAGVDLDKSKVDLHASKMKGLRDIAASVNSDADMPMAREAALRLVGPDEFKQLPFFNQPFNPENKMKAITGAEDFLKQVEAQKGRDVTVAGHTETARHNAVTEGQSVATLKETSRHHAALEGDPKMIEDTAQAIAKGQLAPLSGFALSRPSAQSIMSRVTQINPDFDPTQFQTRQKAEKDFATGKQGNSVRSFNVALSHLDTMEQLSDALNNKDTQLINQIGNTIATQTGSAAPVNFEAAKKIVGDEIVKAIVGSGGGVHDREEAAKTISAASSPAQLKGVINTYKELMRGQIGGLRDQYKSTTGKDDFDTKYLSESGRTTAHKPGGPVAPVAKAGGIKFLGFE